jgi:preprotein translocase subunit SecG
MDAPTPSPRARWFVLTLRWGVPLAIAVVGIVLIVQGQGHVANVSDTTSGASVFSTYPTGQRSIDSILGVTALVVAVMVWMVGWLMRMTTRDGKDRQREEEAREYFARTGRWPGESGPAGPSR